MIKTEIGDDCQQCGHPFDPHSLVCVGEPQDGGFIVCQVMGCECYSTWGVGCWDNENGEHVVGPKPTNLPDRFEIAGIRENLQRKYLNAVTEEDSAAP